MKKKLVSIFLFVLILIFNITIVYSTSQLYVGANTNYYIMDTSDSTTTITSSNVVFTQDDNYFYFDITQVLKNNSYIYTPFQYGYESIGKKLVANCEIVHFALLPVSNMSGLYVYPKTVNSASGGSNTLTVKLGGTEIAYYNSNSSSTTITNRKSYPMYISCLPEYDIRDVLGTTTNDVSIISSSNTWVQYSVNDWTSNVKFRVLKTKIDKYRYFRFFQKLYWQDNKKADSGYQYEHRSGITNYSLDLKSISNCEHEWTFSGMTDKTSHSMSCSKCKWHRTEEHSYLYEYDGLKENLCMCGKNNYVNVKYHINDDTTKILTEKNESYSEIQPHKYNKKTGHEFLYYKKYRIELEDINDLSEDHTMTKQVFVENVHDIESNVENYSLIYEAEYRPYVYYIQFNIENNYELEFDSSYIDMQMVVYDEPVPLNGCKLVKEKYNFMGWAVKPDMSKVVFQDEAEVLNLSDIDNDIINLYPVFLPYTYTVYYTYTEDPDYIVKKEYTFNEEIELEDFDYELGPDQTFIGWDILNDTLTSATTKHLEQYLSEDKQVLYLKANVYVEPKTVDDGNADDDSSDTGDSSGGSSNTGGGSNSGGSSGGSNTGDGSGSGRDTDYPKRPKDNNNNNSNVVEGTGDGTPPYNNNSDTNNANNANASNNANNQNNSNNNAKNTNTIVDNISSETKGIKKFTAGMVNLLNVKGILSKADKNKSYNEKASVSIAEDFGNADKDKISPNKQFLNAKMLKNIGIMAISGLFLVIFAIFIVQTYKKFIKLEKKYKSE